MKTDQTAPKTIDEYIAGFPPDIQALLEKIRLTIRAAAPDAEETIKYQMPTFTLKGNLVHFAAFKHHIGFYPAPTGIEEFKDELAKYAGGKGSVQFPLGEPIPFDLISRIVKFRVQEDLARAAAKRSTKSPTRLECDAILFDLDGVLIDSSSCIVRHWQAWADRHGLDVNQVMQVAHGTRTIDTIRAVAPHLDAAQEAEQFTEHEVIDTVGVVAIAGAAQLLASLPADAWAIVTSGGLELVKARLQAAGLPAPKILVTADDVTQGKPAPEPYLVGAQRFGLAVERCVVIEDAPAGITAGKKAGMRVIGIAATHTRDELLASGADVVVDKLINLDIRQAASGPRLVIQSARE